MHILVGTQQHCQYVSTRIYLELHIMTINWQINEPSSWFVFVVSYCSDEKLFLSAFCLLHISATNFG